MDVDILMYHNALADLTRSSRAFASAIVHAAEAAGRLSGDDLITIRTFEDCRRVLLDAFARAPGMIQLLGGKGE